jgi:2-oxo-4-hydroxy-4-carboxy-5-ureidoimidazoline decarboxylase
MGLQCINDASPDEAQHIFLQCCTSKRWIEKMVKSRPYATVADVLRQADVHWQDLGEEDYLEAFEGHPKIGDVNSLKKKYANTKKLAAGEQSGVDTASDAVIDQLAEANRQYQEKFGFIFIVCATGKSAQEMSDLLQTRLENNRQSELGTAAKEQRKIFQIRLKQLLGKTI